MLSELPDYLTAEDLEPYGITLEDVRSLDPEVVEYVSLDHRPCWHRDELVELLGAQGGDE